MNEKSTYTKADHNLRRERVQKVLDAGLALLKKLSAAKSEIMIGKLADGTVVEITYRQVMDWPIWFFMLHWGADYINIQYKIGPKGAKILDSTKWDKDGNLIIGHIQTAYYHASKRDYDFDFAFDFLSIIDGVSNWKVVPPGKSVLITN